MSFKMTRPPRVNNFTRDLQPKNNKTSNKDKKEEIYNDVVSFLYRNFVERHH